MAERCRGSKLDYGPLSRNKSPMGQQSNKVQKRRRRLDYKKRKKAKTKAASVKSATAKPAAAKA
jgi:hypothetical protein